MTININKEIKEEFEFDYEKTINDVILAALDYVKCPYECMVECLTMYAKEEDKSKIIRDFEESHTYILICERGSWSPSSHILTKMYELEKKHGVAGFVKVLMDWYHPDLDNLD